jgi:TonB family protein
VRRFDQRQGFLVSAVLHLALLMVLMTHPPTPRKAVPIADVPLLERKDVIFLPPAAVLRQLLPAAPRPAATPPPLARPLPVPTPPPPGKKDRVSVGPPTNLRTQGPLILRREDDLTKVPKGQSAPPVASPKAEPGQPAVARNAGGSPETPGREGLRLPPGLSGSLPRGEEGSRRRTGSLQDSIANAVEGVARRMERDAELGLPTGTGHNMGGLMFDPQGADFTVWVNRFKNEVYRNWIVPEAALFGYRGHVDFEFTVERDGTISSLRMLKPSGTTSLDRAARNALTSSRLLPLPEDYGPPRITMQVTFVYNEAPQGS